MASVSTIEWIDQLTKLHVLEANQLDELKRLSETILEPKRLAKELIQRGWLSAYQANLLLQNRGHELLLGSYVLIDKLGEGGMGAVFRARNWKLGRNTAIKLIRKERLSSPDAVRRFYREIRAAAQLEHPNVVRTYDADEVNGAHFFAMEYVDGVDLAKLVQQHGPLPPALACDYIRQAALGLQHAHERGMVHRDIKPANLLLARGNGPGTVKVLDMGLARLDDDHADEDSGTLTQVGMVMGTPDYMAPEQSLSARTVDIRADLYSLGCSLYFLLTASVPFPGGSLTEKLLKHQLEEPRPIEMVRPEVPALLTDVVYKLIAKKPADRYQTPRELADALQALIAGQVFANVPARPRTSAIKKGNPDRTELQTNPFWEDVVARVEKPAVASRPAASKRNWLIAGSAAALLLAVSAIAFLSTRPRPHDVSAEPPLAKQPAAKVIPRSPQPLFGLNDLHGFRAVPEETTNLFSVDNGVLSVPGKPHCYLYSPKSYRNFRLSYEIKHPNENSNSGVFLHIQEPHGVWPRSIELQGYYKDLGKLFGVKDSGRFPFNREVQARALKPVGEWNRLDVTSNDGAIVSKLNGVVVSEGIIDLKEGPIGFQSEYSRVQFRNVMIDELPASSQQKESFVPLFNGVDLTGWTTAAGPGTWSAWKVRDGAITCFGRQDYLYSERNDLERLKK